MLERTYAYRLYPNTAQQKYFEMVANTTRALYNMMLKDRTENYQKTYIWKRLDPEPFVKESLLMRDLDKTIIKHTVNRLEHAFRHFFYIRNTKLDRYRPEALERIKIEPHYQLMDTDLVGYPKMKSKANKESWEIGKDSVLITPGRVHIPGMGAVKVKLHRPIPENAEISFYTILKKPSGHFCLLVHLQIPEEPMKDPLGNAIGIALVPGMLAQCSDGLPVLFRHISAAKEQRIEKEYLKLTGKTPGSSRYEKQRKKLALLHEKTKNQRRDSLHKTANCIVEKVDVLVVEEAAVLRKKKGLTQMGTYQTVLDEAWWTFTMYLKYKSQDAGKLFWRAPMDLPVRKACSVCGVISDDAIEHSQWVCPVCGVTMTASMNAARNLEHFGNQSLTEWNELNQQKQDCC